MLPYSQEFKSLKTIEGDHIRCVLRNFKGHLTKAAGVLGISRATLYRKLLVHDLVDQVKKYREFRDL
jgi:transcriptional regulator of acetoin/glycerol metabolism